MNIILTYVGLLMSIGMLIGCTEDRQLQTLLKPEDQIMAKANVDLEGLYLYVPLGQESSRSSLYGRAYEVGQSKVVKIQINEFSLDVLSIEKETRFDDNPNNQKILISVPVEHVDYRCQDDAYGECIGSEVEDNRVSWKEKKYIRPDFAAATIIDTNFFAYEFAGPRQCYQQEQVEVLKRSLGPEALNFTLKRDFKDQLYFFCIRNHDLSDFTNLNWTETTSYSLVKLDSVATKTYPKAVYHPQWINTFGFFEVDDYQLDVDGNATQDGETKYIQRWNPNREDITYHLSSSFNKPENQTLKAATYESFDRINQGLKTAGVSFQLRLEEPRSDIDPGDLRNTMIVLVDDPLASGVIGYGPSIANPLTGEVISARTVMYSGSIRKFVRFTYDDIVRVHKAEQAQLGASVESQKVRLGSLEGLQEKLSPQTKVIHQREARDLIELQDIHDHPPIAMISRTPELSESEVTAFLETESKRDFIAIMAQQNKYPAEALSFGDVNQELVRQMITEIGSLEPWEDLSPEAKKKALDVLTPYVWIPTLVHEIGHNLGLRHNFSGSEDSDNFYSNEELLELNVPISDKSVPYSSVMDYPKSEINALRTLGKYDLAALKFGYQGVVALDDGTEISVPSDEPTDDVLAAFDYCSDEGVAPNPTCNPFDEGTGMKAITQSLIESYEERYARSNFRRGRANFSGINDDFYLRRLHRTFRTLRLIYERYESLVKDFDLDQETIDQIPWLKEIDESVEIAADFMMKVIATPDTTCIVQSVDTGVLQIVPIGIFSELAHDRTRSCESLQLNEQFVVVGSAGKPINSLKLPSNPNRFADQIDVRGIWIDKVLAMRTLFQRTVGSTLHDGHNGNFLDHPAAGGKLVGFLGDLLSNRLVTPVEVTFVDGMSFTASLPVDLDHDFYEITKSELSLPHRMLGLKYDNSYLPEVLSQTLKMGIYQGSDSPLGSLVKSALKVYHENPDPGGTSYLKTQVQGQLLFVSPSASLAAPLVVSANRAQFFEDLNLTRDSLLKVLDLLENPQKEDLETGETVLVEDPTQDLDPAEKVAFERGAEDIRAYLDNETTAAYYKRILFNL